MDKMAPDFGDSVEGRHTIGRTCGRISDVEAFPRTEGRRSWTAEQKLAIVGESLGPDLTLAEVARKHRVTTGQIYAWRQRLLGCRGSIVGRTTPQLNSSESASGGQLDGQGGLEGFPGPRQQRVQVLGFGLPVDDTLEHIGQPSHRIDAVQLGCLDQGHRDRPVLRPGVGASKQRVLAGQGVGADGALDDVGVCALARCTVLPGENPGRQTLAPAGSTRGGSGGDEWPEALREKTPLGGQRTVRAATRVNIE